MDAIAFTLTPHFSDFFVRRLKNVKTNNIHLLPQYSFVFTNSNIIFHTLALVYSEVEFNIITHSKMVHTKKAKDSEDENDNTNTTTSTSTSTSPNEKFVNDESTSTVQHDFQGEKQHKEKTRSKGKEKIITELSEDTATQHVNKMQAKQQQEKGESLFPGDRSFVS
eukprot:TRINITY_DN1672_c0_g1_i12.p2 TRINITY_DN1672_c0_g1~~TRINITY_DN1672_c0_g1_i12.p2  ORF type:complete len:166 (-),score=51.37 TRINITY_DN1672_c0_g1_i12:564-1061(-)